MLPPFINLGPGETQRLLTVSLTDDQILEDTETFSVRISVADEDTGVDPDTATVSILNDDSTLFVLFCLVFFICS